MQKQPSRSARRKKAKKRWLREQAQVIRLLHHTYLSLLVGYVVTFRNTFFWNFYLTLTIMIIILKIVLLLLSLSLLLLLIHIEIVVWVLIGGCF
jgi:hypothetical protein